MFRSSKILKLAFIVLGAVVLMSAEVEASKMRQNGLKNTLSQQITPGVTNSQDVETKGKCRDGCSVAEALAAPRQARASVSRRRTRSRRRYEESDDSDSDDEEDLAAPTKKPC